MHFFLFVLFIITFRDASGSEQWERLLHFTQGKNQVVSGDFFLSDTLKPDDEKKALTTHLNNPLIAQDYACAFPARTESLAKEGLVRGSFNFKECKELTLFIDQFPTQNVSLVFSSENISSPASMFGHVFLLFHKERIPELDSKVIHYSAILDDSSRGLGYIFKGLMGGFQGAFGKTSFFRQIIDYSRREQRYIQGTSLNLSPDQVRTLLFHLFELRLAKFKYYFFNENCAYQIDSLLGILPESHKIVENKLYTLPIEIYEKYGPGQNFQFEIEPLITSTRKKIKSLTDDEKKLFDEIIQGNREVLDGDSETLKSALYDYYSFNFYKSRHVLPGFDRVRSARFQDAKPLIRDQAFQAAEDKSSRLSISGYRLFDRTNYELHFRPVLVDEMDNQRHRLNELEFTMMDLRWNFSKFHNQLEELKIFNTKNYFRSDSYFPGITWGFYLGLNRDNPGRDFSLQPEFTFGSTRRFFNQLDFSATLGPGLDTNAPNLKPFLAGNARLQTYLASNLKLVIDGRTKIASNWSFKQAQAALYWNHRDWIFFGKFWSENTDRENVPEIGLSYYF